MMKTLIFEVTLLWHVRKYQHDLHPVKCQHKHGIGGDLCPQRDSSPQQPSATPHAPPSPPPKKKTKQHLCWCFPDDLHTLSALSSLVTLSFLDPHCKSHLCVQNVASSWRRDVQNFRSSACTHTYTHKEENCIHSLIEMYTLLKSEQIQTSWMSPWCNYSY